MASKAFFGSLRNALQLHWPIVLVFACGLAIRLVALQHIAIINPDGILYINQAKAIAGGQWQLLREIQLPYVSLYPLLIAGIQHLVSDWILSGQLISLASSMGMLVVLYRLLRLFFDRIISQLTTLLYAVTPLFVRYSVDVMRDSLFWFFFTFALWLILLHLREGVSRGKACVLLSCGNAAILLASWSRIEGIILFPVTILFLCLWGKRDTLLKLGSFAMPSVCVGVAGAVVMQQSGHNLFALVRLDEVVKKMADSVDAYHLLRQELKTLADGYGFCPMGNYLQNSYHTIWATAFGGVVANAMEAFFPPYVIFHVAGFKEWCRRTLHLPSYRYVTLVLVGSLLLLLVHFVQSWVMTYRFMAILMLPAFGMAALGVQRILASLSALTKIGGGRAVALMAIFLVLVSLGKNLRMIEADKAVYVTIGKTIAKVAGSGSCIAIASKFSTPQAWINFYATVNNGQPCTYQPILSKVNDLNELVAEMQQHGLQFFVWEQRTWEKSSFGSDPLFFEEHLKPIGHWWHRDTGKIMLFRLITEPSS